MKTGLIPGPLGFIERELVGVLGRLMAEWIAAD
jgi:hypothetical protein